MYHSETSIDDFLRQLPDEIAEGFLSLGHGLDLHRGTHILEQGQVCGHLYKVESGILRTYRRWGDDPEQEITSGFSFPGDFDTSPSSLILKAPSLENIQAVTDARVIQFDFDAISALRDQSPALNELIFFAFADYMAATEQVLFDMRVLSARQRYNKLLAEHPGYVQQIPLKYLASFLNMKVETLSRVRRG
jgi:CRP-like cAMP-binding protein